MEQNLNDGIFYYIKRKNNTHKSYIWGIEMKTMTRTVEYAKKLDCQSVIFKNNIFAGTYELNCASSK